VWFKHFADEQSLRQLLEVLHYLIHWRQIFC